LKNFPDSGAPRPAVSPIARIGVISPYLVIYEFDPASGGPVTIQRIVHGRRKITGRMLFRNAP
jgi:toxin ParE1/3/4